MEKWTKNELISKLSVFLINPKIQFEKREILLKARQDLENDLSVKVVLRRLHSDLSHIRRLGQSALGTNLSNFDDELVTQITGKEKVIIAGEVQIIKKAKIMALIGAIVGTMTLVRPILIGFALSSAFSSSVGVIIILLNFMFIFTYWWAYVKIGKEHGLGWSIYLLVLGIFSTLGVLLQIISLRFDFTLLFMMISAIAWIMSFVYRVRAK